MFFNLKHDEVIIFDNLDSFRYFYEKFYNVGNINLSRTLMFISSIATLDMDTISPIFKDLYHMGIIRLAFIIKLVSGEIFLLTYFPFTPTSCHDFKPVIVNHYLPEQQRWSNLEYFPKKLGNFHGCPLTCCAWFNMPYFDIKYDTENKSVIEYMGIEAKLLEFLAKKLNFSINIHPMDNKVSKAVYNEGSIFAEVFSKTCDFALGGFAYRKDLDSKSPFSQTIPFYLSSVHMVTNVLDKYATYEKLTFPFHSIVWYTLGVIFAITSLLIFVCEQQRKWEKYRNFLVGSTNTTPNFHLYTSAVGAVMKPAHLPRRNFARFLLTSWLLSTLVIRSAYQSGMYQMLRHNFQKNQPQTIESVFKQNYLISMTPENRRYLPLLPEVKSLHIFNSSIKETFPELLKFQQPIAFIAPYEHFGYFGRVNTTQWGRLHLVRERLITQPLTVYVRHHSYLTKELNGGIIDAQYYGFVILWERQTITDRTKDRSFVGVDNPNVNTNILSMGEFTPIFMIHMWLNLFSINVFLIEIVWHKYGKVIKNRIKF